jgi:murein hydrolase activator
MPPETPSADAPPSPLQQDAERMQEEIRRQQAEVELFRRDENQIAAALETAGRTLQRHRNRAARLEREAAEIEENIASTAAAVEDISQRIRADQAHLSRRLTALYKTQALGVAFFPGPADSPHHWLLRRKALEQMLAHDERSLAVLVSYRAELHELQVRLEHQREALQARREEHARQMAGVAREKRNREHLLAQIRSRKELQQAALTALQQAAEELEATISALHHRMGSETHRPETPFAAAKGLLIFPVKGKIVKKFGPFTHPTLKTPVFHNGIEIAADRGEPVRAVHAGRVVFADWFKGFGNVLIIDHGQHYYTVHAHLEELFKPADGVVKTEEVVATVGDSGALGIAGLYFELRHYDTPLDPLEWLNPD